MQEYHMTKAQLIKQIQFAFTVGAILGGIVGTGLTILGFCLVAMVK